MQKEIKAITKHAATLHNVVPIWKRLHVVFYLIKLWKQENLHMADTIMKKSVHA